ncbi:MULTISPECIES: DUF4145 domain-containing protein [unclassified Sphingomonas]|uniref:DUF4145 domain-containing protein n=1 Tax=Novosphingobium rhizosphaerae TaxID=1551649 RepID=UPI0015C7654E
MKTSILTLRFDELVGQLQKVEATKHYRDGEFASGEYVDNNMNINWKLKARHLISLACGEKSEHYRAFENAEKSIYTTNYEILLRLKAIFEAAREDYEAGLCNSFRNLVQAEVFSSELDQARELMEAGYLTAAAVIAGTVLETTLRELCDSLELATGKLDKMNADLAKAGHYNLLVQKRITALADIRNNAAHGHPEKFTKDDVRDMIEYIEGFVGDQL